MGTRPAIRTPVDAPVDQDRDGSAILVVEFAAEVADALAGDESGKDLGQPLLRLVAEEIGERSTDHLGVAVAEQAEPGVIDLDQPQAVDVDRLVSQWCVAEEGAIALFGGDDRRLSLEDGARHSLQVARRAGQLEGPRRRQGGAVVAVGDRLQMSVEGSDPPHQSLAMEQGGEHGEHECDGRSGSDSEQGRTHGGEGQFFRLRDQRQPAGIAHWRHRTDVFLARERKTLGVEATGEAGLDQRQLRQVLLACGGSGIRMRDHLAEAVDDDRQQAAALAKLGDVSGEALEIEFTDQRPAFVAGERNGRAQGYGDGDDDPAALRQVAVGPQRAAGRPCRADEGTRREVESDQFATLPPPFARQPDFLHPPLCIEKVERVQRRVRMCQRVEENADALG